MSSNKEIEENEHSDNEEDITEEGNDEESQEERVPVDLSQNEFYRGICTLLEDEEGNNILEYISLLHTELIGINKSLENLRSIRKDISRIADCAELAFKGKKTEQSVHETKKDDTGKKKTK